MKIIIISTIIIIFYAILLHAIGRIINRNERIQYNGGYCNRCGSKYSHFKKVAIWRYYICEKCGNQVVLTGKSHEDLIIK